MQATTRVIQAGEMAPPFRLPSINRDGSLSLQECMGERGLMLGFFRGLHCPFCRRQIAQLGSGHAALLRLGVETAAVLSTPVDRARLYFRYRPTPITLLSDPECATHRAFGVPRIGFTAPEGPGPDEWPQRVRPAQFEAARIDPTGEIGEPTQPMAANEILNKKDGFEMTPVDAEMFAAHGTQLAGQFLLDRAGIVRWAWTEGSRSPQDIGRFPTLEVMATAARAVSRPST